MRFLVTIKVKSPVTGAFEKLVVHEVDFDEFVPTAQAAAALVEIERELTREYVRCNIEGIQEDDEKEKEDYDYEGND